MLFIIINLLFIYYNVYIDYKSNYRIANNNNKNANPMNIDLKLSKKEIINIFMIQLLSEQLKDKIQMISWFEIYSNKSYEINFIVY